MAEKEIVRPSAGVSGLTQQVIELVWPWPHRIQYVVKGFHILLGCSQVKDMRLGLEGKENQGNARRVTVTKTTAVVSVQLCPLSTAIITILPRPTQPQLARPLATGGNKVTPTSGATALAVTTSERTEKQEAAADKE